MTQRPERLGERLSLRALKLLFALGMAAILVLVLFFSRLPHACPAPHRSNLLLLPLGLALIAALWFLLSRLGDRLVPGWIVFAVGTVFLALQILAVYRYYFDTAWDVSMIRIASSEAGYGRPVGWTTEYYSVYPNNLLLVRIYSWIFAVVFRLGGWERQGYFALLAVQCALSCATGWLLYFTARDLLRSDAAALLAYGLYLLVIGLSPWVAIPYSDSMALLFPMLLLRVFTLTPRTRQGRVLQWFSLGGIGAVGYRIKPTVMIFVIAAALQLLARALSTRRWKTLWRRGGALVAGIVCGALLAGIGVLSLEIPVDRDRTFGPAHFLAMGMNPRDMGAFSGDDVAFSAGFPTAEERTAADLALARDRIRQMGVPGLARQFAAKTLTNFDDGTFAWGVEGGFFSFILPEPDAVSGVLRSFYYPDRANYALFANYMQALWLAVLLLAALSLPGRTGDEFGLMLLTLGGMIVYTLLFEARARYLYIYVPYFLLLAARGAEERTKWAGRRFLSRGSNGKTRNPSVSADPSGFPPKRENTT